MHEAKYRNTLRNVFVVATLALLCACESDFIADPARPRPTRAVENSYGLSDPNHEVMGATSGAMPLVTIDFPNNKYESATVRTVMDDFSSKPTSRPAASQPAPEPAPPSAPPAPPPPPAPGNDEIKIVAQQRPADQFRITKDNQANLDLWVVCPSGIGTVTLERSAESWPAVIRVHLRYDPEKEFSRLEGFNAVELTATGNKVALKTTADKLTAQAQITIPGFARSQKIQIEWVDMYR